MKFAGLKLKYQARGKGNNCRIKDLQGAHEDYETEFAPGTRDISYLENKTEKRRPKWYYKTLRRRLDT